MRTIISMVLAMAVCTVAGCASQPATNGERAVIQGGSGITVFGTVDAAVSGTRNR